MRMPIGLAALLAVGLFAKPMAASAAGVVVGDKEWRQLTETAGVSYDLAATVCSTATGMCSGSVFGRSFDGWTWASHSDVQALFDMLIQPGTTQFPLSTSFYQAAGNDADIDAAIGAGAFAAMSPRSNLEYVQGLSRTLRDETNASRATLLNWYEHSYSYSNDYGDLSGIYQRSATASDLGFWMYRSVPAPVPLPAAAWLLLSGLAGLGFVGRRKAG